jgi:uncharacterized protein (DUF488 family)
MPDVFTIGYANRSIEQFIALLRDNSITAVADVRSIPFSRSNPEFNKDALKQSLDHVGVAYVFLGKELGARTEDAECYSFGRVEYGRLAATSLFQAGLNRIQRGSLTRRIALMCAEKEPFDCHRCILVGRPLSERGLRIVHILGDGQLEEHSATMRRLMQFLRVSDAFGSEREDEKVSIAYRIQAERIAFKMNSIEAEQASLWR